MSKKLDIYYFIGLFGLLAFRYLPEWWHILAFIPVIIGFSLHYGDKNE